MRRIKELVRASDSLVHAGAMLHAAPEIDGLPENAWDRADVVVPCEWAVGVRRLRALRQRRAETSSACVVATDQFDADDMLPAVRCRVNSILCGATTTEARLAVGRLAVGRGAGGVAAEARWSPINGARARMGYRSAQGADG